MRFSVAARAWLLVFMTVALAGCGAATTGQSTAKPTVRIVSPTSFAQISTSTVTVRVAISHFTLAAGGLEQPGSGQVWIYANGHVESHLGSTTTTLGLAPGTYFLKAALVTNGRTVASSASVVVTVSGSVSLPPPSTSGAMPTLPTISCASKPVPSTGLKAGTITLFCKGLPQSGLINSLVAGPGGDLWFTEQSLAGSDAIGRITPTGSITLFSIGPLQNASPGNLIVGPDGNLWFTAQVALGGAGGVEAIGRVTPTGAITLFSTGLPHNSLLGNIVTGPDGNLWFTVQPPFGGAGGGTGEDAIGRITPSGTVTLFSNGLPQSASLGAIVAGPDGNLWFTEESATGAGAIGRITPAGRITLFASSLLQNTPPGDILAGPDGDLWFAAKVAIGRITPAGEITLFPTGPLQSTNPGAMVAGPDGDIWFVAEGAVGQVTPSGTVTVFAPGGSIDSQSTLTAGPDGSIWFALSMDCGTGGIGRVSPSGKVTEVLPQAPYWVSSPFVVGPDGNIWFAAQGEALANVPLIGRIVP